MLGLSKPVPASGTLRVVAALLSYPDAGMRGYLPEMRDILRSECALSDARQAELDALIESLASADPLETEANYVELFSMMVCTGKLGELLPLRQVHLQEVLDFLS